MSTEGRRALERQLGAEPPPGVAALADAELGHLADAVQGARRRQARALHEAGERALARIPRVLRGPIRRVVG